ncbi:MAG: UvrD-helicase domain-containing protein [Rubripirellula sp.]
MSKAASDPLKQGSTSKARPADAIDHDPVKRVELMTDEVTSLVNYVDTPIADPAPKPIVAGTDGFLRPTLVRASAGTGKTYRLTARLMRILLQGAAPESILATTFTRKAAGEILDRVLLSLAEAADEDNDDALESLRQQVGIPTLPRSVCLQLLGNLLRNIHRLRVCTLDSLFAQLARSFPFELGLPPAWRLTDEIEEVWLKERAVDSVIGMLEPAEMTAVLSMLGKGEIKRSIARELLQVVDAAYSSQRQCGQDVWSQLTAPTLPEESEITQAAGLMRMAEPKQKRHRDKLEQLAELLELREFGPLVNDTLVGNISLARRTRTPVKYYRAPFPDGLDPTFDVLYAAARTTVLSLLRAQNEATGTVLAAYDHHVVQLKHAARALGFDDVTIRLASQFASLDHRVLSSRMDGAIDHVLLDEFQDTSPAQWQVLRPLAARAASFDADPKQPGNEMEIERSFFCVGDTKQAIYGWRGGVAEIFDAVADQLPGVDEVEQNTSFRSSPVVLDVVNETFLNLHRHPLAADAESGDPADKSMYEAAAVKQFSRRFPPHDAFKSELAGYVRFQTARLVEDGDSQAKQMACFEDAAQLAAEINQTAPGNSIGILTRTNRGVAQLIFLLERLGVEVSQEGGNPLTDSAAVELVLSALMMAEHPGDGRWAFHLSATPLAKLPGFGADMVRSMTEEKGLSQTIRFLAGALAPDCDTRETLRLKQLTHLAIAYEQNAAPRLRDFVRMVREKRVERPQAAPVRVMTVHQAKGLEFDAVILAELDGPLTRQSGHCVADARELGVPPQAMTRYLNNKSWHFLPDNWQRAFGGQAASSMTEAMCLLYVAMTRAKQALHLVVQPTKKATFDKKTAASLIYHALSCQEDPTTGSTTLFETGDPDWHHQTSERDSENQSEAAPVPQTRIEFRRLPAVPHRNR